MATVVSLTEDKIRDLLGNWEGLSLTQAEINEMLAKLALTQNRLTEDLDDLNNNKLPQLQDKLDANDIAVADLHDNLIPSIDAAVAQQQGQMEQLTDIILPNLQADLNSGIENSLIRPQTFFSDEPPESTEDRELQISDIWHDTDNGNRQHRWDGTQWVTFTVDVADFSVTARKLISTRHLIY